MTREKGLGSNRVDEEKEEESACGNILSARSRKEREMEEAKERLRLEWQEEQKQVREEMLEVVYSYWDGTGHRRSIKLKKGTTVGEFLEMVRQQLSKNSKKRATPRPTSICT